MSARLSPKQVESFLGADARVNIWHGAVRSGKTLASILAFMRFLETDCSDVGRPVIIGNSLDTVYRNVISEMINLDPDNVLYTKSSTVARIYGREVDVIGAPDVKAERRIRGMTIPAAYVDEASLLPDLGFWQQLLNRQITVPNRRTFATTNPDNPFHFFKVDVIDRADALRYHVWHFVPDDNPVLTDTDKADLAAQNTGVWFRRNVLGEWVIADGLVYDGFDPERHIVDELPPMLEWLVAIDPGAAGTHAAVLVGLGDDEVIHVAREWRWVAKDQQRSLTDVEVAAHLAAWLDGCEADMGVRIPVWSTVVDSEDKSMVSQLWADTGDRGRFSGRFGTVAGAEKGQGSVVQGIRTVASLLAVDRLRVHSSCTGLIDEMRTYSWDPKAALLGEDKPVKQNDHLVDAQRYGIRRARAWWRPWLSGLDDT